MIDTSVVAIAAQIYSHTDWSRLSESARQGLRRSCLAEAHALMSSAGSIHTEGMTLAEVKHQLIKETVRYCGGNKAKAAKILGITRQAIHLLYRKGVLSDDRS